MTDYERIKHARWRKTRSGKIWEVLKKYDYFRGGYDFIANRCDIVDGLMPMTKNRFVGSVTVDRETLQPDFKWKDGYMPRIGGVTLMTVYELNDAQMAELKQHYVCETVDNPSHEELASAADIPDEVIHAYYDGIFFSDDDFFCTTG